MVGPSGVVGTGKRVYSDFSKKNVTFMAAGLAYNAFVSLAPLLILLLFVVSIVGGGGLEERLISMAESGLPGPIADTITQIFSADEAATGASIVGLVVLLWGTLKIFRGLDTAFSEIYETRKENSFKDKMIDGIVVFAALIVSVVATVVVSAVFARFASEIPYLGYLSPLILVAGLVLAFFPIYYRFPDKDLGWRDVLPGTIFAAIGWAALQAIFQVYLSFGGGGGVGDFFGGVIVVVTWLYFSGLVILLGAVLNSVVGDHSSGASGGVGRGAAYRDRDQSKRSMNRDQLADYLRDLREQLGYYEGMEPTTQPNEEYRPSDEIEVIEQSKTEDDERERTITLRWRTPEGDAER